jgi:nicotinamidase-related amidase
VVVIDMLNTYRHEDAELLVPNVALYTALDANVRHFSVVVAPDAVAHIDPEIGDAALTMMHKNMHAEIVPAEKCLH